MAALLEVVQKNIHFTAEHVPCMESTCKHLSNDVPEHLGLSSLPMPLPPSLPPLPLSLPTSLLLPFLSPSQPIALPPFPSYSLLILLSHPTLLIPLSHSYSLPLSLPTSLPLPFLSPSVPIPLPPSLPPPLPLLLPPYIPLSHPTLLNSLSAKWSGMTTFTTHQKDR